MYHHEMVSTMQLPINLIVHTQYIESQNVLRHWHRAIEINYSLTGKAEFVVSGNTIYVDSGEIIIINSNEIHSVRPMRNSGDTLSLTFQIPYEFLKHEIVDIDKKWFVIPKNQKVIDDLKENLYDYYLHYQEKNEAAILLLKSYSYLILFDLVSKCTDDRNKHRNLPQIPTLNKLSNVISYVNEHSAERLSLSEISSQVHLSEGYLARTFRKQMNLSVMEYVNLVRLKKAFEILTNTDKNIEVISDMEGFANPKSFRRLFMKIYQTTPGKYRENLKRS